MERELERSKHEVNISRLAKHYEGNRGWQGTTSLTVAACGEELAGRWSDWEGTGALCLTVAARTSFEHVALRQSVC
jgi:hypothetical protein